MQDDAIVASAFELIPKSTRSNSSPLTIPIFPSFNSSLPQDSQNILGWLGFGIGMS